MGTWQPTPCIAVKPFHRKTVKTLGEIAQILASAYLDTLVSRTKQLSRERFWKIRSICCAIGTICSAYIDETFST